MKRIIQCLTILGVLLSANIWAHHMAEGVISDELWSEIDDNLEAASSPHLDVDFDALECLTNLYDCMGTDVETIGDDLYMVTTVDVYLLTPEDQADPDYAIDTYFEDAYLDSLEVTNKVPSGTLDEDTAAVFYVHVTDVDEDDDGIYDYAVIELYEPLGDGRSQQDAGTVVPAPGPGKQDSGG